MFATIITEITAICVEVVTMAPTEVKVTAMALMAAISSLIILRTEKPRAELENQEEK